MRTPSYARRSGAFVVAASCLITCASPEAALVAEPPRPAAAPRSAFQFEALTARDVAGFHSAFDTLSAALCAMLPRPLPAEGDLERVENKPRTQNLFEGWDHYRPSDIALAVKSESASGDQGTNPLDQTEY